jgi:hypothetical protein
MKTVAWQSHNQRIHPRRHSAVEPQPRQQALFHHRGTEFAEIGILLDQELFTPRLPRLRGEISGILRASRNLSRMATQRTAKLSETPTI